MPLQKNQIIPLAIQRLSSDGSGVGHWEGEAVFVPGTAPGDQIQARVVKDCKRYAFGIVEQIDQPSPDRIPADCPVAGPCGGCSLRHLRYQAELQAKQASVADAFQRIGGLDVQVEPILPSPQVDRYRNKVQFPVGLDKQGKPCIGFYAGRSHRIVPCGDCKLQPAILNRIGQTLCGLFGEYGIQPYDEATGQGLVRHIFLRQGAHSGQIMVCLVCTRPSLPHARQWVEQLRSQFPDIATILINVNRQNTNVILGSENHILFGPGSIEDTLCGVPVRLGPFSFYQVNTPGAEQLYAVAAAYADLRPDDLLLDLYCGMGTIGLSMAGRCRELVGVEIVPEAIESARANAVRMGGEIAGKSRFFCADAGQAAARLAAEGLAPDVIIVDPPRKGCDQATLDAVVRMAPRRLVYVSCNPATAARDAAILTREGYRVEKVQPVDMFPRTGHVETVVLLGRELEKSREHVYLDYEPSKEIDLPGGATYSEIKQWIQAEYGLKVSSLYVAQVKQKHGIIERECYNNPKSENVTRPQCPPEKEAAIEAALKHFKMI
ncbi:23S rRNA (uracil(1939)-C(5))-methyltransferase RlmD [Faecalibacterium sp. An58]|uniref:23S rRNA (uracil(1939)-C(5))-methyltransferase RlmD n=1 Tax=Faecalibacterium sp. An58 TaxID=1965648 RepID=UPI000B38D23E|nr:23S rRNA (uracil(1939)-C(5))-methyltransferase RlmD [Faecalibacterium sp. An58]